jgi:tetratricopeptide (TPR) repeat protein
MQQQAAGMENPLLEANASTSGRHRVAFRHEGRLLEPIAGQFMFDFSPGEKVVASVPATRSSAVPQEPMGANVAELFAHGVALEDDPRSQLQAIASYERVLQLDPEHAAAHINLGTLYYNRQDYRMAEDHYREALRIDPRYALAHFDLGNVLDETGRINGAVESYLTALQLAPTYADAHYNLALAYEKMREPRKALKHWQAYVKLDSTGPWSTHARAQIKRILKSDPLKLIFGGNVSL